MDSWNPTTSYLAYVAVLTAFTNAVRTLGSLLFLVGRLRRGAFKYCAFGTVERDAERGDVDWDSGRQRILERRLLDQEHGQEEEHTVPTHIPRGVHSRHSEFPPQSEQNGQNRTRGHETNDDTRRPL